MINGAIFTLSHDSKAHFLLEQRKEILLLWKGHIFVEINMIKIQHFCIFVTDDVSKLSDANVILYVFHTREIHDWNHDASDLVECLQDMDSFN